MGETSFNIKDLRRLYADSSAAGSEIELCYSREKVLVKALKIKDKKELLKAIESKNENAINKSLDDIIEKYVEYASGDVVDGKKLTTQERHQLLVNIRIAAGNTDKAKLVHQCPECEHLNKNIQYNIENMCVEFYDKDEDLNDFLELADGKIKVYLGPLYREDEIQIEAIIKRKKLESNSEKQFAMLAGVIKKVVATIDGVDTDVDLSMQDKIDFFEQLSSSDLDLITEYFENIDFGVKMPFDFKCEKCGYESEENVNVAVFFIS
jgi:hypothetical protein